MRPHDSNKSLNLSSSGCRIPGSADTTPLDLLHSTKPALEAPPSPCRELGRRVLREALLRTAREFQLRDNERFCAGRQDKRVGGGS